MTGGVFLKLDEITKNMLVAEAYEAQKMAYVPYSDFCVGAALLAKNGKVYRAATLKMQPLHPLTVRSAPRFSKRSQKESRNLMPLLLWGIKREKREIYVLLAESAGR